MIGRVSEDRLEEALSVIGRVSEDRLEEALSVGVVQQMHGVVLPDSGRIKSVIKYSRSDSAPTPHGLFVEFEGGDKFEVTIRRLA